MEQSELWPPEWDPVEIAYFAGLFDGEGSVGIYHCFNNVKRGRYFAYRVSLSNTDPRPLDRMAKLFGGSRFRSRVGRYQGKTFVYYEWMAVAKQAERFLAAVLPYLIIKRDQADLFLRTRQALKGRNRAANDAIALPASLELKRMKLVAKEG